MAFCKHYIILTIVWLLSLCSISCDGQVAGKPAEQEEAARRLPNPTGWVSDFYDLYTPSEEAMLNSLIDTFEKRTTIEIALVTLREDMTGPDSLSLDEYTLDLARAWGIGKAETANGILVGISPAYKRMRIQNGYGIEEIITNEETAEIVRDGFFPGFAAGSFFEGTLTGLKMLMERLEENMEKKGIHF